MGLFEWVAGAANTVASWAGGAASAASSAVGNVWSGGTSAASRAVGGFTSGAGNFVSGGGRVIGGVVDRGAAGFSSVFAGPGGSARSGSGASGFGTPVSAPVRVESTPVVGRQPFHVMGVNNGPVNGVPFQDIFGRDTVGKPKDAYSAVKTESAVAKPAPSNIFSDFVSSGNKVFSQLPVLDVVNKIGANPNQAARTITDSAISLQNNALKAGNSVFTFGGNVVKTNGMNLLAGTTKVVGDTGKALSGFKVPDIGTAAKVGGAAVLGPLGLPVLGAAVVGNAVKNNGLKFDFNSVMDLGKKNLSALGDATSKNLNNPVVRGGTILAGPLGIPILAAKTGMDFALKSPTMPWNAKPAPQQSKPAGPKSGGADYTGTPLPGAKDTSGTPGAVAGPGDDFLARAKQDQAKEAAEYQDSMAGATKDLKMEGDPYAIKWDKGDRYEVTMTEKEILAKLKQPGLSTSQRNKLETELDHIYYNQMRDASEFSHNAEKKDIWTPWNPYEAKSDRALVKSEIVHQDMAGGTPNTKFWKESKNPIYSESTAGGDPYLNNAMNNARNNPIYAKFTKLPDKMPDYDASVSDLVSALNAPKGNPALLGANNPMASKDVNTLPKEIRALNGMGAVPGSSKNPAAGIPSVGAVNVPAFVAGPVIWGSSLNPTGGSKADAMNAQKALVEKGYSEEYAKFVTSKPSVTNPLDVVNAIRLGGGEMWKSVSIPYLKKSTSEQILESGATSEYDRAFAAAKASGKVDKDGNFTGTTAEYNDLMAKHASSTAALAAYNKAYAHEQEVGLEGQQKAAMGGIPNFEDIHYGMYSSVFSKLPGATNIGGRALTREEYSKFVAEKSEKDYNSGAPGAVVQTGLGVVGGGFNWAKSHPVDVAFLAATGPAIEIAGAKGAALLAKTAQGAGMASKIPGAVSVARYLNTPVMRNIPLVAKAGATSRAAAATKVALGAVGALWVKGGAEEITGYDINPLAPVTGGKIVSQREKVSGLEAASRLGTFGAQAGVMGLGALAWAERGAAKKFFVDSSKKVVDSSRGASAGAKEKLGRAYQNTYNEVKNNDLGAAIKWRATDIKNSVAATVDRFVGGKRIKGTKTVAGEPTIIDAEYTVKGPAEPAPQPQGSVFKPAGYLPATTAAAEVKPVGFDTLMRMPKVEKGPGVPPHRPAVQATKPTAAQPSSGTTIPGLEPYLKAQNDSLVQTWVDRGDFAKMKSRGSKSDFWDNLPPAAREKAISAKVRDSVAGFDQSLATAKAKPGESASYSIFGGPQTAQDWVILQRIAKANGYELSAPNFKTQGFISGSVKKVPAKPQPARTTSPGLPTVDEILAQIKPRQRVATPAEVSADIAVTKSRIRPATKEEVLAHIKSAQRPATEAELREALGLNKVTKGRELVVAGPRIVEPKPTGFDALMRLPSTGKSKAGAGKTGTSGGKAYSPFDSVTRMPKEPKVATRVDDGFSVFTQRTLPDEGSLLNKGRSTAGVSQTGLLRLKIKNLKAQISSLPKTDTYVDSKGYTRYTAQDRAYYQNRLDMLETQLKTGEAQKASFQKAVNSKKAEKADQALEYLKKRKATVEQRIKDIPEGNQQYVDSKGYTRNTAEDRRFWTDELAKINYQIENGKPMPQKPVKKSGNAAEVSQKKDLESRISLVKQRIEALPDTPTYTDSKGYTRITANDRAFWESQLKKLTTELETGKKPASKATSSPAASERAAAQASQEDVLKSEIARLKKRMSDPDYDGFKFLDAQKVRDLEGQLNWLKLMKTRGTASTVTPGTELIVRPQFGVGPRAKNVVWATSEGKLTNTLGGNARGSNFQVTRDAAGTRGTKVDLALDRTKMGSETIDLGEVSPQAKSQLTKRRYELDPRTLELRVTTEEIQTNLNPAEMKSGIQYEKIIEGQEPIKTPDYSRTEVTTTLAEKGTGTARKSSTKVEEILNLRAPAAPKISGAGPAPRASVKDLTSAVVKGRATKGKVQQVENRPGVGRRTTEIEMSPIEPGVARVSKTDATNVMDLFGRKTWMEPELELSFSDHVITGQGKLARSDFLKDPTGINPKNYSKAKLPGPKVVQIGGTAGVTPSKPTKAQPVSFAALIEGPKNAPKVKMPEFNPGKIPEVKIPGFTESGVKTAKPKYQPQRAPQQSKPSGHTRQVLEMERPKPKFEFTDDMLGASQGEVSPEVQALLDQMGIKTKGRKVGDVAEMRKGAQAAKKEVASLVTMHPDAQAKVARTHEILASTAQNPYAVGYHQGVAKGLAKVASANNATLAERILRNSILPGDKKLSKEAIRSGLSRYSNTELGYISKEAEKVSLQSTNPDVKSTAWKVSRAAEEVIRERVNSARQPSKSLVRPKTVQVTAVSTENRLGVGQRPGLAELGRVANKNLEGQIRRTLPITEVVSRKRQEPLTGTHQIQEVATRTELWKPTEQLTRLDRYPEKTRIPRIEPVVEPRPDVTPRVTPAPEVPTIPEVPTVPDVPPVIPEEPVIPPVWPPSGGAPGGDGGGAGRGAQGAYAFVEVMGIASPAQLISKFTRGVKKVAKQGPLPQTSATVEKALASSTPEKNVIRISTPKVKIDVIPKSNGKTGVKITPKSQTGVKITPKAQNKLSKVPNANFGSDLAAIARRNPLTQKNTGRETPAKKPRSK